MSQNDLCAHLSKIDNALNRLCVALQNSIRKGDILSLPITKKQFNNSIVPFILVYKRLPFNSEDDIAVEIKNDDGELEVRPYRAGRYINSFYKSADNMITELFAKKIITYELVGEITGIEIKVLKDIISGKLKKTDNITRIFVENFFDKDYFDKDDKYAVKCMGCKNKCKQKYNVTVTSCKKYKSKKK